jgi:hypothetical protein
MTYVKLRDCRTSSMKSILHVDMGISDSRYWTRDECMSYLEHLDIFHLETTETTNPIIPIESTFAPASRTVVYTNTPGSGSGPDPDSTPSPPSADRTRLAVNGDETYGNLVVHGTVKTNTLHLNGIDVLAIVDDAMDSGQEASEIVETLTSTIETVTQAIEHSTLNIRHQYTYDRDLVDFEVQFPNKWNKYPFKNARGGSLWTSGSNSSEGWVLQSEYTLDEALALATDDVGFVIKTGDGSLPGDRYYFRVADGINALEDGVYYANYITYVHYQWVTVDSWTPTTSSQRVTINDSVVHWSCHLKFEVVPDSNRRTAPSQLRIKLPYPADVSTFTKVYPVSACVEIVTLQTESIIPTKYAFISADDNTHVYIDHVVRGGSFDNALIQSVSIFVDASYSAVSLPFLYQVPMRLDNTNTQLLTDSDVNLPSVYTLLNGQHTWSQVGTRISLNGTIEVDQSTRTLLPIRVALPISAEDTTTHVVGRGLVTYNNDSYQTQVFIAPGELTELVIVHKSWAMTGTLVFAYSISYNVHHDTLVRMDSPYFDFIIDTTSELVVQNVKFYNVVSILLDKDNFSESIESQWNIRLAIEETPIVFETSTRDISSFEQMIPSSYVSCDVRHVPDGIRCDRIHAHDYTYRNREYLKSTTIYSVYLCASMGELKPRVLSRRSPNVNTSTLTMVARNPIRHHSDTVLTLVTITRHRLTTKRLVRPYQPTTRIHILDNSVQLRMMDTSRLVITCVRLD